MRTVTFKGMLARKLRLAMTALSITLGVAFVSGTFVLGDTMTATFDQLYAGLTRGIDVTVRAESAFTDTSTLGESKPFEADVLDSVRRIDGVAAAEGGVSGYALILDRAGKPVQPGGAPTLGTSFPRDMSLAGDFTLRSGAAPQDPDDVVIDAGTARKTGYRVGDAVTVLFVDGPQRFTVSGVAGFGDADNLAGATLAAFELETAQRLLDKVGEFDTIDVRAARGVSADELRARVSATLPSGLEAVTTAQVTEESAEAVADALTFFTVGLLGFAAISLLVGALIIWNTFSILVAQRTRELALLRAVGASRRQVLGTVVAEAFVVGVIAAAAGLGLGVLVAAGLRRALGAIGIEVPTTTLQVEPRTIVAALLVGVVVTVVAALLPARAATKVSPVAALRAVDAPAAPVGRARIGVGTAALALGAAGLGASLFMPGRLALAGVAALLTMAGVLALAPLVAAAVTRTVGSALQRLGGVTASLARRNALRSPRRTANTATTLMIGIMLVSAVTVIAASMRASVADIVANSSRADFIVTAASAAAPGIPPALAEQLRTVEGVATVSELRMTTTRLNGAGTMVAALDPDTIPAAADLDVTTGALAALDDRSVLVSDRAAAQHGWGVGSTVNVAYPQTGEQRFRVAGTFANTALVGTDYITTLKTHTANGGTALDVAVLLVANEGVAADDLRPLLTAAIAAYPNAQLDDAESFVQARGKTIDQLLGIVTMLLALAVIIALLGIINTLALSVFERTRELGLLRAVGATRRQVRSVVRWESVIVAALGALLGAALGLAFGAALSRGLADSGLSVIDIPGERLLIYVAVAMLAGLLAAVLPARRAAKVDVLQAVAAP